MVCRSLASFELALSIPNEDGVTHSQWVVYGSDLSLQ